MRRAEVTSLDQSLNSMATPRWTDTHCHLHDLTNIEDLLHRSGQAGVNRLVCIGTSGTSSAAAMALASSANALSDHDAMPLLWATVGQHPHDASSGISEITALLASSEQVISDPHKPPGSVVAIGECGLDYHYDYSPREQQRDAFIAQIALACEYGLALVVHTRDAWEDTFAILQSNDRPEHVIIHCFTGGPDEARRCLELGAYLSFSGIATFKNAEEIRLAVDLCPVDRLLIETDAPYLAPVPHRGAPNEPAYVALVGEMLAQRKGIDVAEFADVTAQNATEVFGLIQ